MPAISENFASLVDLDPVLAEVFYQHYDAQPTQRQNLFRILNSTKAKETDQRIGSFPDPKVFDGQIEYVDPPSDYDVTYTHEEYTLGFMVERKLLDDMQYEAIFDKAENLATAFARKKEKDAASVLNNAFTAGATAGYDAVALCADSHPIVEGSATTKDNALALTLSSDNLETAITTMQDFGDDQNEEISIMPDLLVVPRALRRTGLELTESELRPDNAENAVNVHQGMQLMVWPYLTDTNAWFVVDTNLAKKYLKWYERILPEFEAETNIDRKIRKYSGYMRYSFGWSDWRWIIGSNPS